MKRITLKMMVVLMMVFSLVACGKKRRYEARKIH